MKPLDRVERTGQSPAETRKAISFQFNGRTYQGLQGDTLASALLANAVKRVGRSFKLHRPRGLMGSGLEEPNALIQLEGGRFAEPNVRATVLPLYEGLRASTQNAWPSVNFDVLGVLDCFHRLLPASFYYKSMMWPSWSFFEKIVRPIAGLGKSPTELDAQHYQKRNEHCELLICGGGPAGLSAALAAGLNGIRTVVVDDREAFGGSIAGDSYFINERPAQEWVTQTIERLKTMAHVRLLPRTTVSGYYENNFVVAAERVTQHLGPKAPADLPRERLWRIHARHVILATGAMERPLVFPNNDRPGVMLASAVRAFANQFGVVQNGSLVIVTNNDDAYRTAFDLHDLGHRRITLIDTRTRIPGALLAMADAAAITVRLGCAVANVQGRRQVKAVEIAEHLGGGKLGVHHDVIPCDVLAMSGGWTPTVHLFSQAGGNLRYDEERICLVPDGCAQAVQTVGAGHGVFALADCLFDGFSAGLQAARALGKDVTTAIPAYAVEHGDEFTIEAYFFTSGARTDKQWLDFQYDVKVSDIDIAIQENFVSVEHVKRYTTGGMSVDQGKSSNFNILAVMAELTGRPIPDVGTTRFRPPFQPVSLGAFAGATLGQQYAPWQQLPAHDWHVRHAAKFGDYGFKRPEYYPRPGEDMAAATLREVHAVRQGVGLFDGSPLGKIEVRGPDAALFLNRLYVNNLATLKPGFARYAMMTNENGILIDDGVIVRLAPEHFLVHATSGAAGRVHQWMEQCLQCEWPDLRVLVVNATAFFANVTVSGPKARNLMLRLDSDVDFSAAAFAHMQYRTGRIAKVPVRVLRASFTGEITYEVSFAARYAQPMWELFEQAGKPLDVTPYGIEALEVLRTEKGYLHIGGDTDGNSNPLDIGWGPIIDKKVDDFIGRRSLLRPGDQRSDRLQFVGLEALDPTQRLPVGGHVVGEGQVTAPIASQGYVTAACVSPSLGKSIGLGIVQAGASRLGETVQIYTNGRLVGARIVKAAHFDPKGERLND